MAMMAADTSWSSWGRRFSAIKHLWVSLGGLFSKANPGNHQAGGSPLDTSARIGIEPPKEPPNSPDHQAPHSTTTPAKPNPPPCGCSCGDNAKGAKVEIPNKLVEALYNLEMVKTYIPLVFPVATIVLTAHSKDSEPKLKSAALCSLCFALPSLLFAGTLRLIRPSIAVAMEHLSAALIYAAFFLSIGAQLPEERIWVPILCFTLCIMICLASCLPFAK